MAFPRRFLLATLFLAIGAGAVVLLPSGALAAPAVAPDVPEPTPAAPGGTPASAPGGGTPVPDWLDACPSELGGTAAGEVPVYEDDPVIAVEKRAWEESLGGQAAARPHVQARLRGWPSRTLVDPATLPAGGRELLERIARDTWRGLDALSDRENGLPVDHVRLTRESTALSTAEIGDYANVTNIGLFLLDLVAARDLGYLTADDAVARARQVLDTLERLESFDGLLYNYYDTTSLERTSNFLSFVDLSWLAAGLIATRTSMPALAERATALLERTRLGFLYDAARGQVSHGYFTHRRAPSRFHYGVLYTEARLGVLLAIGKGEVPRDAWYRMVRVFPPACTGQTQVPEGVRRVTIGGQSFLGGWYAWRGTRYVPSWGGSMFEALMPLLVLDEIALAPRGLGANDRAHAEVQRRYATEELGYPVWGLSPSARPRGRTYGEFGVRVLGMRGYPAGAVSPHATALALAVDPERATAGLRALIDRFPIYGEYGFYDAVDPLSGDVAYTLLALDQSMLFLAVANHLTGGGLRARFAADPIVAAILPLLGEESFFE